MLHDYTENQQTETNQSMFVHAFSPLSLLAVFFFEVFWALHLATCVHMKLNKKQHQLYRNIQNSDAQQKLLRHMAETCNGPTILPKAGETLLTRVCLPQSFINGVKSP